MYRDAEMYLAETVRAPLGDTTVPAPTVAAAPPAAGAESAEKEIMRLTWSVLDGSASLADRQRLAELVKSQHAVRRRIDR